MVSEGYIAEATEQHPSISLCPLEKTNLDFILNLIYEILEKLGNKINYIHIGADEVFNLGTCPKCIEFTKYYSKNYLYSKHIRQLLRKILEKYPEI